MENKRRKVIPIEQLEIAKAGFANGISLQLAQLLKNGEHRSLNEEEKQRIIESAAFHYGKFLNSLGVDYINDPNSMETPMRVAKAYVNDKWRGRYEIINDITSFPSDGYHGIILERDIPIISMCSHHHEAILGKCHIAYIPEENGKVIGLSKLNRIVEHFARRGSIQEQLTIAIHKAVNTVVEKNQGVYVIMVATHNCVSCRGIKHMGASMITAETSGVFSDHSKTAKQEVLEMLKLPLQTYS